MTKREMATELANRRFPFQGEAIRGREYKRLMSMSKNLLEQTYAIRTGAKAGA